MASREVDINKEFVLPGGINSDVIEDLCSIEKCSNDDELPTSSTSSKLEEDQIDYILEQHPIPILILTKNKRYNIYYLINGHARIVPSSDPTITRESLLEKAMHLKDL